MATTAKKPRTPAAAAARCDALSEVLAESWWMVGLRGILGIIFGLICLFETDIALMSLILLFSAYLLVDGLFAIAAAAPVKPPPTTHTCSGVPRISFTAFVPRPNKSCRTNTTKAGYW